jgi:hypothetical protein
MPFEPSENRPNLDMHLSVIVPVKYADSTLDAQIEALSNHISWTKRNV